MNKRLITITEIVDANYFGMDELLGFCENGTLPAYTNSGYRLVPLH